MENSKIQNWTQEKNPISLSIIRTCNMGEYCGSKSCTEYFLSNLIWPFSVYFFWWFVPIQPNGKYSLINFLLHMKLLFNVQTTILMSGLLPSQYLLKSSKKIFVTIFQLETNVQNDFSRSIFKAWPLLKSDQNCNFVRYTCLFEKYQISSQKHLYIENGNWLWVIWNVVISLKYMGI